MAIVVVRLSANGRMAGGRYKVSTHLPLVGCVMAPPVGRYNVVARIGKMPTTLQFDGVISGI